MKNLAPDVLRQRLLVEATYQGDLTPSDIERYLRQLPATLDLTIYTDPVVYSPGGEGRAINQGYDGFVALVDSGIAIYVWENVKFLSVVVYTCKRFDEEKAIAFTRDFFNTSELVFMSF